MTTIKGSKGAILLLSPCGLGNVGDTAIQDAAIGALRRLDPSVSLHGVTLNPEDTTRRHGIPASTLVGHSLTGYLVVHQQPKPLGEGVTTVLPVQQRDTLTPKEWARALVPAPLWRLFSRVLRVLRNSMAEARHILPSWRLVRGSRALIISGGGQFDDFWGGALGHPYALARWAALARLAGVPVYVMGVGAGEISSRATRCFLRYLLKTATFRSFRDAGSREAVLPLGAHTSDLVCPDLAFGLFEPSKAVRTPRSGVIAVSPIAFCNPEIWPIKDQGRYEGYLDRLAHAVAMLIDRGWFVKLFQSDASDLKTSQRVAERAMNKLGRRTIPLDIEMVDGPSDILQIAEVAAVVCASRLHSLIIAGLRSTPLVAISYDRKVDAFMEIAGLQAANFQIDSFSPHEIVREMESSAKNQPQIRTKLFAYYSEESKKVIDLFRRVIPEADNRRSLGEDWN